MAARFDPAMLSPGWKVWGLTIITVILGVIIGIRVSVHTAETNTRELLRSQCEILAVTINAYEETPPTTKAGRNLQQAQIDYYQGLGCPEPQK